MNTWYYKVDTLIIYVIIWIDGQNSISSWVDLHSIGSPIYQIVKFACSCDVASLNACTSIYWHVIILFVSLIHYFVWFHSWSLGLHYMIAHPNIQEGNYIIITYKTVTSQDSRTEDFDNVFLMHNVTFCRSWWYKIHTHQGYLLSSLFHWTTKLDHHLWA